jgi:hypothetical protein
MEADDSRVSRRDGGGSMQASAKRYNLNPFRRHRAQKSPAKVAARSVPLYDVRSTPISVSGRTMKWLVSIESEDGDALLRLTWRDLQTEQDRVEVIAMPTPHAAREAQAILTRLAPAARRESLVRRMIRTAPRKPRGEAPD